MSSSDWAAFFNVYFMHLLTLIEMLVILNESLKMPWPHYIPANVTGKGHLITACFREKKIKIKLILMSV